jgi:hypothetical protein
VIAIAGVGDRLRDHHLAVGLAADLACHVGRDFSGQRKLELSQSGIGLINAENTEVRCLLHFVAERYIQGIVEHRIAGLVVVISQDDGVGRSEGDAMAVDVVAPDPYSDECEQG